MQPDVSIIIPCFNAEDTISEAIQSALDQTHSNIEVIVVNDGSTDGSFEKIALFGEQIRCISQPNSGANAARNNGLRNSNAPFVQFLDADDILFPDKVATALKEFETLPENSCPVLDWTYRYNGPLGSLERRSYKNSGKSIWHDILLQDLQTSAPLHKKDTLINIQGWREDLPCCQEKDLHIRLTLSGISFVRSPQIGLEVRQQRHSVSFKQFTGTKTTASIIFSFN